MVLEILDLKMVNLNHSQVEGDDLMNRKTCNHKYRTN